MRVQLSLNFEDEELFKGFIEPYKRCRCLNSLIKKLLSAYYYNPDIRALFEGFEQPEVETELTQLQNEVSQLQDEVSLLQDTVKKLKEENGNLQLDLENFALF